MVGFHKHCFEHTSRPNRSKFVFFVFVFGGGGVFDLLVFYLLFIFVRFPVFYVLDIGCLILNVGLGIFSFHGLCGCLVT